ncbi:hypothetical protein [Antarcticimicrobium luteum]|uniref:Uncharacterized protein n=1 Tax=Antarcticimicrobium luteum TaxID=2547397 RepID=A0A4R5VEK7_9RHOB|nr:hypothetical protein [Antarcticimicrobium luteum]TDK50655.1 hypothetical protein E1832_05510 [Antarcticimicrobium luteum]
MRFLVRWIIPHIPYRYRASNISLGLRGRFRLCRGGAGFAPRQNARKHPVAEIAEGQGGGVPDPPPAPEQQGDAPFLDNSPARCGLHAQFFSMSQPFLIVSLRERENLKEAHGKAG